VLIGIIFIFGGKEKQAIVIVVNEILEHLIQHKNVFEQYFPGTQEILENRE